MECGQKIRKDRVFCIPKKVIPMEQQIMEDRVHQGLYKTAWGPYRNAHFLVPKKNGKYCFIISLVSANRHTLEDDGIPPKVEKVSETFALLPISSLIDFHCGYDQQRLHDDSQGSIAFQTTQGIYRPTRLVQGATNAVSAFVRVSWTILKTDLDSIAQILIDDVRVNHPNSRYRDEEVEGLLGVPWVVMEHRHNLDKVLADVERAGTTMSAETSDWCWKRVKIAGFVCREAGRWPQVSKVDHA